MNSSTSNKSVSSRFRLNSYVYFHWSSPPPSNNSRAGPNITTQPHFLWWDHIWSMGNASPGFAHPISKSARWVFPLTRQLLRLLRRKQDPSAFSHTTGFTEEILQVVPCPPPWGEEDALSCITFSREGPIVISLHIVNNWYFHFIPTM